MGLEERRLVNRSVRTCSGVLPLEVHTAVANRIDNCQRSIAV